MKLTKLNKLNKSTLSIWLGLLATLIVVSCTEDAVTQGNTPPSDPVIPEIAITSGFSIVVTDGNSTEDKNRVIGKVFAKSQESTNRIIRIERFVKNKAESQTVNIYSLEVTNSAGVALGSSKKAGDTIRIDYDSTGKQIESGESKIFVTNGDNTVTAYNLELSLKEVASTTYTGKNIWDKGAGDAVMSERAVFTLTGLVAGAEVTWELNGVRSKTLSGTSLELRGSDLGITNAGILGNNGAMINHGDQVPLKIWVNGKGGVDYEKVTYYDSEIYSWQGLQAMRKGLTNQYVIKKDITFPTPGTEGFPVNGFIPVGGATQFTGSLDGGGHRIKDFYISNTITNSSAGIFGGVGTATIKNLFLEGGEIKQEKSGDKNNKGSSLGAGSIVGGVLGGNLTLSNVGVSGFKLTVKNYFGVGGLVGVVRIGSGGRVNIQKSYYEGDVEALDESEGATEGVYVGGLLGYSENISIKQSYVKGNVTGIFYVGGLVGRVGSFSAVISEAYFEGTVKNLFDNTALGAQVAGIIGGGYSAVQIADVYAVGDIIVSRVSSAGIVVFPGDVRNEKITVRKTIARMNIGYDSAYIGAAAFTLLAVFDGQTPEDVYYDKSATIRNTQGSLSLTNRETNGGGKKIKDGNLIDIAAASEASFTNFDFTNVWEWRGGGKWPALRNVLNKDRQP